MITDIDFCKEIEGNPDPARLLAFLAPQEVDKLAIVLRNGAEQAAVEIAKNPGMDETQKQNELAIALAQQLRDLSRDMGVRNLERVFDLTSFVRRISGKL